MSLFTAPHDEDRRLTLAPGQETRVQAAAGELEQYK